MKPLEIQIESFSNIAGGNVKVTHLPTGKILIGSFGRNESRLKLERKLIKQMQEYLNAKEEK